MCLRLTLLNSVNYLFFLLCSPSSQDYCVLHSITDNIHKTISLQPFANIFVFGDFNAHPTRWIKHSHWPRWHPDGELLNHYPWIMSYDTDLPFWKLYWCCSVCKHLHPLSPPTKQNIFLLSTSVIFFVTFFGMKFVIILFKRGLIIGESRHHCFNSSKEIPSKIAFISLILTFPKSYSL